MAFSNPADSITFPSGASNGQIRMVIGADTPPELQLYGIRVALLFYVTDFESGLESGYFFIALSNTLDVGNDEACLFGSVVYPVYGNPASAGQSDVKTHFQMSWDLTGAGASGKMYTVFKDKNVQFNSSVPQIVSNAVQHFWHNAHEFDASAVVTGLAGADLNWSGPAHFMGSFNVDLNAFFNQAVDVQGNLTNYPFASASVFDKDDTSQAGFTNTAGVPGSPVVGSAFTAPASGKVWVTVGGVLNQSINTEQTHLSWEMYTGGIVGAGSLVSAVDFRNGVACGRAVNTSAAAYAICANRVQVGGLTPGATYNVQTLHWVSAGGTGTIDRRHIAVEPCW